MKTELAETFQADGEGSSDQTIEADKTNPNSPAINLVVNCIPTLTKHRSTVLPV
jgi:hypothetical protein